MKRNGDVSGPAGMLQVLAEFRHQLRTFLQFSETAAERAGLQPQQHQLLLQIAGAPAGLPATIGYAAERLLLRHHSVVELANRCEEAGLVRRRHDELDRRSVVLEVTPQGQRVLAALSIDHARELNELAPRLIQALAALEKSGGKTRKQSSKRSWGAA
jgi:DNA-binding MarR family transcriptional regulator